MRVISCLAVVLALTTDSGFVHAQPKPDPTSSYKKLQIRGFQVLVNGHCYEQKEDTVKRAIEILEERLEDIKSRVPVNKLATLRKVRIWIEWDTGKDGQPGRSYYLSSVEWLRQNGYNLDKEKGIEISMRDNLTIEMIETQPMFIMHELAHAYHYQVLGYDDKGLADAYQQAKERKLYERSPRLNRGVYGNPEVAYAMNNVAEFFAEATEAYFGLNDYFPFTWQDLKRHDPVTWDLMEKVWGKVERLEKEVTLTVVNRTGKNVDLSWLDGDGKPRLYASLKPNDVLAQTTYSGHRWVASLQGENTRILHVSPNKSSRWVVSIP